MRISVLAIGAFASILTTGVFADTKTLTTQDYVDTADALKQDKIAGRPTTRYYPASVIADTTSDGVIEKRVLLSETGSGSIGGNWGAWLYKGRLIQEDGTLMGLLEPRGFTINDAKRGLISAEIINSAFGHTFESIDAKQGKKVCVRYIENAEETSANCLLWNLPD